MTRNHHNQGLRSTYRLRKLRLVFGDRTRADLHETGRGYVIHGIECRPDIVQGWLDEQWAVLHLAGPTGRTLKLTPKGMRVAMGSNDA